MPRVFRVCHVITRLELGGAQENTLYTVSHLRPPFLPSLVCGPGGILDEDAKHLGVPLRFVASLQREVKPWLDIKALIDLVRIFRRERPDIVHTHSSKAGILGRLAARLAGVPKVVHTIHGYGFNSSQPWVKRQAFVGLERLAARFTSRFIAVSRANLEEGVSLRLFKAERVSLIRSGVKLKEFEAAASGHGVRGDRRNGLHRELGLSGESPIVGMIACLKPQKSPLTFVEVAARVLLDVPDARFVIAGDGELRGDVERRARELRLDKRLYLLGWRRDAPRVMASLDVLLHTSLWEGLPRVLPEAIASGVPIVSTSVDGITDILQDDSTAIVRSPGDVEGLAAGVVRLLRDRDLALRLVGRARTHLGEFDIDEMVRSQERLYLSLFAVAEGAAGDPPPSPVRPIIYTNNDGSSTTGGQGRAAASHLHSCNSFKHNRLKDPA